MTNSELKRRVEEAIRTEESVTAILMDHLRAIASRSSLPASAVTELRTIFQRLISANKKHRQTLESVLGRICGEAQDVHQV